MADTIRGLETRVPLLQWLPGETFYSLCSRHHRFSGHPISAYTTKALFGHSQAGNQHDLPSRLDSFVERVDDAEPIARQRTLLRFYAPFHKPSVVEDAVASMRSTSVARFKYKLGILTSRFGAHHPLKACRACMASDNKNFGWATWHLDHQFPDVWVCR
ncbi:MAG: TniQ family protein [Ottowia sp.]